MNHRRCLCSALESWIICIISTVLVLVSYMRFGKKSAWKRLKSIFMLILKMLWVRSRRCVWFQTYKTNKSQVVKILSSENATAYPRYSLKPDSSTAERLKMNLGKAKWFAAKTQKESIVAIVMFSSFFIRVD